MTSRDSTPASPSEHGLFRDLQNMAGTCAKNNGDKDDFRSANDGQDASLEVPWDPRSSWIYLLACSPKYNRSCQVNILQHPTRPKFGLFFQASWQASTSFAKSVLKETEKTTEKPL